MLVGDTTSASMKDLAKRIRSSEPDAVIFCGDIANELAGSPRPRQFRKWRQAWGSLADRVYPIPGNHDYARDGSIDAWWDGAAARLGGSADWFDRRAFALELPEVVVLGLDCGPDGRSLDQAQLDWMTRRAAQAGPVPWRIIALHGPLSPVSIHMNAPMSAASEEGVRRLAAAAGAQLLVSGHEHLYARSGPSEPPVRAEVTVGGGGADLYPVIRSGLLAAESRHHHLIIDASRDELRGTAVGEDGRVFDTWAWPLG